MNKTLHKKLTEKHPCEVPHTMGHLHEKGVRSGEMSLLEEAAKDLLQPRPQAIANILKMAREL
jgi:hypothetical protein